MVYPFDGSTRSWREAGSTANLARIHHIGVNP
jgi:hypothetical protein